MRYLLFVIFCCMNLLACNKDMAEMPIDRDKLIPILVDVHLAEAAMQEVPSEKRDSLGKAYYKKVFSIHKVTEADFNKSLFIIRQDPDELEAIYKEVIANLEKREEAARK